MKTTYISIFFLLFLSISTLAQRPQNFTKYSVTGKVIDTETHQALEYATLVFTPKNSKKITGGITDKHGRFDIEVPQGYYDIKVEFLSFKPKTFKEVKIDKYTNLGIIYLESEMENLDEVEIIAETTTVEVKLDKKIYNVGKDLTVKGGNASDVLENVPSVSVDVEGNVSLRGNESVRILIDGKPSGLVGLNSTDALRQLPAEAIQKVEVITSPSARYEAEGTAGILNIILRKSKAQGVNASVSLTAGEPANYGASANVNYRNKTFNLFSNLGYRYRKSPGEGHFYNYIGDRFHKTNEEFRSYTRMRKGFNANIGLEYFLTKNASITGGFLYRQAPGETDIENYTYNYVLIDTESLRTEFETETDDVFEYSLNFTQHFKDSYDHKLTFDVKYEDAMEHEVSDIAENYIIPSEAFVVSENVDNLETQKEWFFKSDYVHPISENNQFEAGVQTVVKDNSIDYTLDIFDEEDQYHSDNFLDFKENIYAAYLQYGSKIGDFSYLTGLRLEHTEQDVQVIGDDSEIDLPIENLDFIKTYNNWFPTLNLTYAFNKDQNITLGFNTRIRRPRSRHLNPFPSRSSTSNVFKGNPELDPVISYTLDLGYYQKWEKLMVNASIYYQTADNAIQFVRYTKEDDLETIYATPINLNKEERIGAELSLTYSPKRGIRINNSANIFRYQSDGSYEGTDYTANDISWFNRFSAKIALSKKSDFQANFFYRGPSEDNVFIRKGIFSANAAYSMDLLKDKATLSLNIQDIFNSRFREMYADYGEFNSYSKFQWRKRQFMLNFTYRFNQKKNRQRPERNGGDEDEMM